MSRIFIVTLVFLLFSSITSAIDSELELKVPVQTKREVEPGASINILATFNNPSNSDKEIQLKFVSNDTGWKFIMNYNSVLIGKKSTLKKVIGIQVPQNFNAGDYTISVEAYEKPGMVLFGKFNIPIQVKAKYEIAITKLKSPGYIFSGDDVKMSYLIENLSNLDIKVKTTSIKGSENIQKVILIPKDSSIVTDFKSTTVKKVDGYSQQSVIYIASVADLPETEKSVYTTFDVFPSETVKFDKYVRFPVKISGILAASNRMGGQMYSGMYDVFGSGTLGKTGNSALEFHLRGPDRTGNPLFGMNDEYYLKFRSSKMFLSMGDYNFGLSELTESSRNGRGIELNYKFKKLTLGSYYAKPRYYPLITQVASAFTSFDFNPRNSLSLGLLTKADTLNNRTLLYSLSTKNHFSFLSTEAEIAFGQYKDVLTKAYKGTLHLNFSKINSHLVYLYAEPNFPGFVSNSIRLNSSSSIQLKKIALSYSYDYNSTNMALDTLYSNMPISRSMNLTFSYRLTPENTVTLSGNQLSLKDQSPTPMFDYVKTSGRISLQNRFKLINVSLIADVGNMQNHLVVGNNESLFINGTLNSYFLFSKKFTGSAFMTYQGGQKNITGYDQFYYGGTLTSSPTDNLSVSLQYNSNYEWQYYTTDRSLFSLNLFARINQNNELNLMANYNLIKNTLDNKEYNVQLRYVHVLNVPVAKKKNMGSVKGKIINHGVDRVNGILVNLNGIFSITDKDGNFRFPALPVGEYVLAIDASTIGLNVITEQPGPIKVLVAPSKETIIECGMTTSGQIAGSLRVEEDERANQKGYIPVKDNFEKLIVEATNGTDMFRIYTDKNKAFRFDDLRPGKWKVKIYSKGLPLGYKMPIDNFEIELTSGKHEFIDVIIQKKARQIQFQSVTKK